MSQNRVDPAHHLVAFIARTRFANIPAPVVAAAKHSICDTIAVAIAGSSQDGIEAGLATALESGGAAQATAWVFGNRLPVSEAAFVNGPMARALDMGDVHEEGGHLGEYILPSLLAAAELRALRGEPVSGEELLTAYVVGAEVLSRIGLACRAVTTGFAERKNPQMGTFGASAAVAKILARDEATIANAFGIAYSCMGSFDSQMTFDSTLMCRMHHGFVCRDAVTAVLLAERGVTGPRNIFTGPGNFFRIYYPNYQDLSRLDDALGERWEFALGNMLKPYMCCKCFHAPMYALRLLLEKSGLLAEDIDDVTVVAPALQFFVAPNREPDSTVAKQFSAPWAIANAAIDGELFLDTYQRPDRPAVTDLIQKIGFRIVPGMPTWVGEVEVRAGGRWIHERVEHCLGHPRNPVDWPWLERKLTACCSYSAIPFSGGRRAHLLETVQKLEEVPDCGQLIGLMTPGVQEVSKPTLINSH